MLNEIKFPIMDMTEFLFESERVFFSDLTWESKFTFKEKYIKKIPKWKYIDADGKLLKVKIIKKEKVNSLLSFLSAPKYNVELAIVPTGKVYKLEELKKEILLKKEKMFHIYHNKLMTLDVYERAINNANSFLEIIDIASFGDYKENNSSENH
ncbi:hypothetical protein KORDIASMS9_02233 [Kordia sp. SMS9]|uniref:hypothetical protein n=1 Tax=Kordia sp. SMS9 TaxID=2282170 RepID=UPI000E0CF9B0|nr:hypothetical protein [Kordia sp. SMS9]AXG70004.1 hypothetical protein KORDIASMS9_02233 [Kordia sp. SMS9]